MLGIGKLAANGAEYYLSISSGVEDYYLGVEAPGRWLGSSETLLDVSGEVDGDGLRAVFAGRHPKTGELLLSAGNRRVAAFDLSFKADKTVSLLHAWATPDVAAHVEAAQSAAIAAALTYLEYDALYTRRGRNGVDQIPVTGLVGVGFRHFRNRNDDPHLHDHVLVPNLVHGVDGRWSTIDAKVLYRHAKTAGYVYQAVLRHELTTRLGVELGPVRKGVAPIAGIPRSVVDAFSTRRAEIVEHLEAVGATSARAAQIATLETRRHKDLNPDVTQIRDEWHERARGLGFQPDRIAALVGTAHQYELGSAEVARIEADLLGADGLTAHASTFDAKDVLQAWCQHAPGGATLDTLQTRTAATLRHPDVVALADGRYTTTELLAVEAAIIERAVGLQRSGAGVCTAHALYAAIERHPTLSREQAYVTRKLALDGNPVSVLVAAAGTGKGFLLGVARDAWTNSGYRVRGVALAARTAAELQSSARIPSTTVVAALAALDEHPLDRRDVVVVDEAGMVGTRQLGRLIEHATVAGAKVVLVGDPRQLPEIQAGGVLAGLARRMSVHTLHENRRQIEPWEAIALGELRNGSVDKALDMFHAHDRIHWTPQLDTAQQAMVNDWATARRRGENVIMLAARREDVYTLNVLARQSGAVTVTGPALMIEGVAFQAGDVVIALRNDRRLGVRNGERGTIRRVNPTSRTLEVEIGERSVRIPASYLEGAHLTHGYAMTIHKAQGLTCDQALVLGTDDLYREMGYVALSRGRIANHLYPVGDPRQQPEPTHAPTLGDTGDDDLLTAALRISKAQTLASEHRASVLTPGELTDTELADEMRRHRTAVYRLGPTGTGEDHPHRERLVALANELDDRARDRAAEALTAPSIYQIDRLGPVPYDGLRRDAWYEAAFTIEHFRLSHNITDPDHALGIDPIDRIDALLLNRRLDELAHTIDPPTPDRTLGYGPSL